VGSWGVLCRGPGFRQRARVSVTNALEAVQPGGGRSWGQRQLGVEEVELEAQERHGTSRASSRFV